VGSVIAGRSVPRTSASWLSDATFLSHVHAVARLTIPKYAILVSEKDGERDYYTSVHIEDSNSKPRHQTRARGSDAPIITEREWIDAPNLARRV